MLAFPKAELSFPFLFVQPPESEKKDYERRIKILIFFPLSNHNWNRRTNTVVPWPILARQSLCNLQRRGAFIAAFSIEK